MHLEFTLINRKPLRKGVAFGVWRFASGGRKQLSASWNALYHLSSDGIQKNFGNYFELKLKTNFYLCFLALKK